jgi:hypothetical protein
MDLAAAALAFCCRPATVSLLLSPLLPPLLLLLPPLLLLPLL